MPFSNNKRDAIIFISFLLLLLASMNISAEVLRLATTTSTQNSGLLDKLLPPFTEKTGLQVHVIAVGTGKALKMGQTGDVDVVMVHAEEAEKQFIEKGFGTNRKQFMFNDFILVGPASDPAGIAAATSVEEGLKNIAESKTSFVSRGDDSGTHKKELSLWEAAGLSPSGSWYREVGQGMGKVLQMANELQSYTLTDRGTWLAMKNKSDLRLLFTGDKKLTNPYGIIAVSKTRYPDINFTGAGKLIDWVCSTEGQGIIGSYTIQGEVLFKPLDCH